MLNMCDMKIYEAQLKTYLHSASFLMFFFEPFQYLGNAWREFARCLSRRSSAVFLADA